MFTLAILIGIYSYAIFSLGLLSILNIISVSVVSLLFILISYFYYFRKRHIRTPNLKILIKNKVLSLLIFIIISQVIVNLVGVLGPELGFDALWYHLTLPKLYVLNHSIFHIPGGLMYYSDMPKLTEMFYTAGLFFGDERIPKLIHFGFGILTCIAIYRISGKFMNNFLSVLSVVVFYSSLVVGWQSTSAYVDLSRTFFEIMALWGFLNFIETKDRKWFIKSALMIGLAISTKLLAIGSLFIFTIFICYFLIKFKRKATNIIINVLAYWSIELLIPFPWFIFSFIHTGNPVYPFFSSVYPVGLNGNIFNPINFSKEMWIFFTNLADPISPIYLIFAPLVFIYFKKFSTSAKIISAYCLMAILVWYITPRTGGGRFILPYLPTFSIISAIILSKIKSRLIYNFLIILILLISVSSIGYRGLANAKYIPVVFGQQTRSEFLSNNLNFSFGDFYDTNGYFKNNIKKDDTVLLYGFHNLYYVNFPFIDSSWVKRGDQFNYIAVQNSEIPKRFSDWQLIYRNQKTKVDLYTKRGSKWAY